MIVSPIMPIWLMAIICAIFIFIIVRSKRNLIRRFLIVILLFAINLRIMTPSDEVPVVTNNLDVIFVVDNTISMVAEDYNGTTQRIAGVKKDCEYIMNFFGGSKFSVITFADNSQIVAPLTRDANMSLQAIKTMQIADSFYAKGSSLNVPIENMEKVLKGSSEKGGRKRIVFFISDGEITNGEKLKSFTGLTKYVDSGAVLGYGTTKGRLYEGNGSF